MNTISKALFVCFSIGILFSSCKKSPSAIIEDGTWYVSLFTEDSKDETSDFSGYVFDFKKDGTLAVTLNTGTVVNGSWTYDDSASKYKITISGDQKLDHINDDWLIVSKSSTLIQLKDDNASKNEVLNFSKK